LTGDTHVGLTQGEFDFRQCIDILRQKPSLTKYQSTEGLGTAEAVSQMYESPHFGGSIVTSKVFDFRNPLMKRLEIFRTVPGSKFPTNADVNKFFCLPNIQWKRGQSKFFDVWIFID